MTYAPDSIKAARTFLLANLDFHKGSSEYSQDLDPAEVGIVGDTGHAQTGTSYHLGKSQLKADSYSIIESSRDRAGLTDAAAALDVGEFTVSVRARFHNLRTFSAWLVAQCEAGTPDTRDIREVIYSLDGKTVKRWDRLGKRTTGDASHTFHTHLSYFRDSEGRDKTALFRRYLTEIGLLEDDDMTPAQMLDVLTSNEGQAALGLAAGRGVHNQKLFRSDVTFGLAIQTMYARGAVDAQELADAIPDDLAEQVVRALSARLAA